MKEITIKNRYTDEVILCGKYESIRDCLEKNRDADLSRADLSGAYLSRADLSRAYLSRAYLSGADIPIEYLLPDIYAIKMQSPDTKLVFWKYLVNGASPYKGCIYEVGKEYSFDDADSDEKTLCAAGGNVATLMWCLKDSSTADEFIEVGFAVKDIAAIPYATDGKFRVSHFKVLRQVNRKEAIGILEAAMVREGDAR